MTAEESASLWGERARDFMNLAKAATEKSLHGTAAEHRESAKQCFKYEWALRKGFFIDEEIFK